MENKQTMTITSHEVAEALEQVRAGFTVSRMALAALTLVFSLCRKDDKWAKKFTKIQQDYHKFLLDGYQDLEKKFAEMQEKEKEEKSNEDNVDSVV